MQDHETENKTRIDKYILVASAVFLCAAIGAFYQFSEIAFAYRVICIVAVLVAVLYVISKTLLGKKCISFIKDAQIEIRKVVWPTKQETLQTTFVVVVLVFFVGLGLWILDMVLFWGIAFLTGQKV